MNIAIYETISDGIPDRYKYAGRIVLSDGTMHPVIFHGADAEIMSQKISVWWEGEVAKASKPDGRKGPRSKTA